MKHISDDPFEQLCRLLWSQISAFLFTHVSVSPPSRLCRLVKVTAALHLGMMDLLIDGVVGKQVLRRVKSHLCVPLSSTRIRSADSTLESRWAMMILVVPGISLAKCRADPGVRGGVDGAGGIIQDQDLRFLQKRSGDTEPLLLSAGYVGAAPGDPRLIAARHPVDKFIGAGCLTCFHALLIGGVRVTPAQVIKNRSGKQRILLQYHGYLISQHSVSYLRTSTPPTQTLPSSTS